MQILPAALDIHNPFKEWGGLLMYVAVMYDIVETQCRRTRGRDKRFFPIYPGPFTGRGWEKWRISEQRNCQFMKRDETDLPDEPHTRLFSCMADEYASARVEGSRSTPGKRDASNAIHANRSQFDPFVRTPGLRYFGQRAFGWDGVTYKPSLSLLCLAVCTLIGALSI